MASPSYTYSLSNGNTADASQVMQNFNDILNGVTDSTKDLSISALTCAGTATLNGNVNLGNSSSDDLTITASLASTLAIKTNNSYDIGSSTLGLRKIFLGNGGVGATCDIVSASHATTREYTIPDCGAAANFVMTQVAQTISGVKTFDGQLIAKGTATNDSASAGYIGELIVGSLVRSSATALTTGTAKTVVSISLTAGDWDITAMCGATPGGATTYSNVSWAISTTTNTEPGTDTLSVPTTGQSRHGFPIPSGSGSEWTFCITPTRASISSTTTFYLVANYSFAVSTLSAYGSIRARRER
jgi:hypothetical protein